MKDPNYNTEFCVCSECRACRNSLKELGVHHHRGEIMLDENYKPIGYVDPKKVTPRAEAMLEKEARAKALAAARQQRKRDREREAANKPKRDPNAPKRTQKEWRAELAAERVMVDGKMVHPNAPHGTITGYSSYSCRCQPCRTENTKSCAARKARQKERERA
jgi:hypothetical protein